MNFKSHAWKHVLELSSLKENNLKARVDYLEADLFLDRSGGVKYDVPTTVVVLFQGENRFVGVSQCSTRDSYNKEKGREIAAGRALKAFESWVKDPDKKASQTSQNPQIQVYGFIPSHVWDLLPDHMVAE